MKYNIHIIALSLSLFSGILSAKEYPIGVEFHHDTAIRKGHRGDNWCQTWASDDNIYTMMDDGNGWWPGPHSGSLCIQIGGDEKFTASHFNNWTL